MLLLLLGAECLTYGPGQPLFVACSQSNSGQVLYIEGTSQSGEAISEVDILGTSAILGQNEDGASGR